jgi:Asp-tRNA(Asn)/Glu-tRNA(Gln) amidotransferase A subunit family amidase
VAAPAGCAGFSLREVGSDLAGSIRIPTAYCGIARCKAREGSIPAPDISLICLLIPFGVALIGKRWQDAALLHVTAQLETVLGGFVAPPWLAATCN